MPFERRPLQGLLKNSEIYVDSLVYQRLVWGAVIGTICAMFFATTPLLENFELGFLEWQYQMANSLNKISGRIPESKEIAIVAFDDASQFDLGIARFNDEQSQNALAKVLATIERTKPTLVAVDLDLRGHASSLLADTLARTNNIVIGLFGAFDASSGLPAAEFLNNAAELGLCELPREINGLVCRLPITASRSDLQMNMDSGRATHIPSFAEAVIDLHRRIAGVGPASRFMQKSTNQVLYINFNQVEYPVISFKDILNENFNPQLLQDKVVLLGSTLTTRQDELSRFRTPLAHSVPEIVIQADAVSSLLNNATIASVSTHISYLLLLLSGAALGALLAFLPLLWRSTVFVLTLAASAMVAQVVFQNFYLALPWVPFAAIVISTFVLSTFIYLDTDLRRRNLELAAAREAMQRRAEEERRRIAEDLHDETLPALSSCARLADNLSEEMPESTLPKEIRTKLDETLSEMRRIINDLHPSVLETMGFAPALENLVSILSHEAAISSQFVGEDSFDYSRLPEFKKLQAYRIVQEALHNICKHSKASEAKVSLRANHSELIIEVADNGIGMKKSNLEKPNLDTISSPELPQSNSGHGLVNIRQRAQLIGARVEWSRPRQYKTGCLLRLTIPLTSQADTEI
jgi:signal transduction histidine kinase